MKIQKIKMTLQIALWIGLLGFSHLHAATQEKQSDEAIKAEVSVFFGAYLDTYNQRFGYPERAKTFIESLSQLIHTPFVMAPPNGKVFYPDSPELLTRSFDGFVQQLEKKGVVKLVWETESYVVLTDKKVLVNNKGLGLNGNGETVYETQSIYLAVKSEKGWKIALFNPYDIDRNLDVNLK